jgi:lipoprotein-anchoring transpeptidase ErfK/SrfK
MRRILENSQGQNARGARRQICARGLALLALLVPTANTLAQQAPPAAAQSKTAQAASTRRIVVSIPHRKLALVEGGQVAKVYPIAVGAPGSPSPAGEFKVVTRITDPTYYSPGVVIPAGAGNPLGPRWIGLSKKSFGIHGTNEPRSIGRRASHGCIRMRNADVTELFELVQPGDTVELIGEATVEVAVMFGELPKARVMTAAAKKEAAAAPVVVATMVPSS